MCENEFFLWNLINEEKRWLLSKKTKGKGLCHKSIFPRVLGRPLVFAFNQLL